MMKKILFVLLYLLPALASADKLIIGGVSKHIGYPVELNESHPAIGLERDGFEYSVYYNSLKKTSFAISKIGRKKISDHFSIGARFGLATGYETTTIENSEGKSFTMDQMPLGVMPQAQFLISHESKYLTIDLGLANVSSIIFKINIG